MHGSAERSKQIAFARQDQNVQVRGICSLACCIPRFDPSEDFILARDRFSDNLRSARSGGKEFSNSLDFSLYGLKGLRGMQTLRRYA